MAFHRVIGQQGGSASVELVAAVPALLVALLVGVQLTLVGQAYWSAAVAARAGARAAVVDADAEQAAREALPSILRGGAEVDTEDGVSVRVDLPRILPFVPPVDLAASAALQEEG